MQSPDRLISPPSEAAPPPADLSSSPATGVFIANETKHLADRLQTALVKVKRLNRLEAALIDFFAEVMERTGSAGAELGAQSNGGISDHEAAFRRSRWKESLLKKTEGDPMSLLNALRTHLRVQFATLDQQQRQVAQNVSAITSRSQVREQGAQDEIQQLETTNAALREQITVLAQQVATSEAEKARLTKQHRSIMGSARGQLTQTREQQRGTERTIEQQEKQLQALKDANEQLVGQLQQLKSRDEAARPSQCSSLHVAATGAATSAHNGALQPCGSVSGGDLIRNTPVENQKLRRALRDYETKLEKSEAAREELRSEVQRLHKQIVGYRQSTQTQNYVRLEKEEKKQKKLAGELKSRLAESDAELLRTRSAVKEREALVQKMKDEYNKLFTALQKHKTAASAPQVSPAKLTRVSSCVGFGGGSKPAMLSPDVDARSSDHTGGKSRATVPSANDNPYLVDLYRAKVEELKKQVEGLQVQIRKMIASEYRHKQQNRLFRVEKKQLVDTSDRLRADMEKAVLTSAKTMTATKALALGEPSSASSDGNHSVAQSEVAGLGSKMLLRASASGTLNEVKRLRQRNQFLEEQFRAVLHSARRPSREAASRDKDSAGIAADDTDPASEPPDQNGRSGRAQRMESSNSELDARSGDEEYVNARVPSSSYAPSQGGSSAGPRDNVHAGLTDRSEPFRSIDATMLESLQKVKRTARVRPKSAAVVSTLQM